MNVELPMEVGTQVCPMEVGTQVCKLACQRQELIHPLACNNNVLSRLEPSTELELPIHN